MAGQQKEEKNYEGGIEKIETQHEN